MKTTNSSTKNCKNTAKQNKKTENCKKNGGKDCGKSKSSEESESDPQGSYTGNPIGFGKKAKPVQDADDL